MSHIIIGSYREKWVLQDFFYEAENQGGALLEHFVVQIFRVVVHGVGEWGDARGEVHRRYAGLDEDATVAQTVEHTGEAVASVVVVVKVQIQIVEPVALPLFL